MGISVPGTGHPGRHARGAGESLRCPGEDRELGDSIDRDSETGGLCIGFEKQRRGHQKPQADTGICFRSIFLEAQLARDFSGGRFLSSKIIYKYKVGLFEDMGCLKILDIRTC